MLLIAGRFRALAAAGAIAFSTRVVCLKQISAQISACKACEQMVGRRWAREEARKATLMLGVLWCSLSPCTAAQGQPFVFVSGQQTQGSCAAACAAFGGSSIASEDGSRSICLATDKGSDELLQIGYEAIYQTTAQFSGLVDGKNFCVYPNAGGGTRGTLR